MLVVFFVYMAKIDISQLSDDEKIKLIKNRWDSSHTIWEVIKQTYNTNTAIYENKADWVNNLPYTRKNWVVHANRIFTNMESVINSLIANPPGVNILPGRKGEVSKALAMTLEKFFRQKYYDLNVKEVMRMALRNLYFSRLLVIKAFWNPNIDDFDYRAIDPRKVRVAKNARKEQDSEFVIEEIEDNLVAVVERFPGKKGDLLKKYGIPDEKELYIRNPEIKYQEAWIGDYVIFRLENIVLDTIKNPYWDWEGIKITQEEEQEIPTLEGDYRRQKLQEIKLDQPNRGETQEIEEPGEQDMYGESRNYKTYLYNYFNVPRKPYIWGTIFNNTNEPTGRTDMITQAAELQRNIDKRKMDIDENCELVNGIIKVDAAVMGKSDAQRLRFETKGIVWGKGVKDGVTRETGTPLPDMVFKDMIDSRQEIDNIMAASSAFRGEREGQETKAGRLALIQQSFLRLNELVQLTDFVYKEMFDWGMQLAKTKYTEYHFTKVTGAEDADSIIELIQDDFEDGIDVKIIAGKSLPVDDEFKFEQAQNDVNAGFISPVDYLEIAQYDNPKELAKNAVIYKMNPVEATGISPEEAQKISPAQEEKPPSVSINYQDLPPDAQTQLLAKIGIQADPELLVAEKIAEKQQQKDEFGLKRNAQEHSQMMSERSQTMVEQGQQFNQEREMNAVQE